MIYLKRFFILVIVVVVLLVVWVMISPKPFSLLVRKMFDGGEMVDIYNLMHGSMLDI